MVLIEGDGIIFDYWQYDAIIVPMGINNSMNRGFAYDVKVNFPEVSQEENETKYGDKRKYGTIHKIQYENVTFVMCYVHNGGFQGGCFVDYDLVEKCLKRVNEEFKNMKVASPVIGCSEFDGRGDRHKILEIMKNSLTDVKLYLYDFEQKDTKHEIFKKIAALRKRYKERTIDKEEYVRERSKIEWIRKNGIVKTMPADYVYHPKSGKIG